MDRSLAVVIPTLDRPLAIERSLENVSTQTRTPGIVLVVDASSDDRTRDVCSDRGINDGSEVRYERSAPGLTVQRRRAIQLLRGNREIRFVCMLDDDILLDPDFLERTVRFLDSHEGADFGGVSGYDLQGWGRPFEGLERLYSRIGLFEGQLRPGRWLYCGRFLELSRLQPFRGICRTDFIGGGLVVWRMDVFDRFLPPASFAGYGLLEDKHLSLRVRTCWELGVLGDATLRHDRAPGGRPARIRMGYAQVRREALLLRDCDPAPTVRRYATFLGFTLVDLVIRTMLSLARLKFANLPRILGQVAGWTMCMVSPPSRTDDAIPKDENG